MKNGISRRSFISAAVTAAAVVPATGALQQAVAGAAPLPLLDVNDPTAKALKYVVDAKKVDPKANPTFKPGQNCANCVQFQGQPTDKQAPCPLFVGRHVLAAGWCMVWAQKPGA